MNAAIILIKSSTAAFCVIFTSLEIFFICISRRSRRLVLKFFTFLMISQELMVTTAGAMSSENCKNAVVTYHDCSKILAIPSAIGTSCDSSSHYYSDHNHFYDLIVIYHITIFNQYRKNKFKLKGFHYLKIFIVE